MRAREEQTTEARRLAIRRLIQGRKVATQEDLRSLLASQGFDVTQGTLSRDLARLGARRAPAAEVRLGGHRVTVGATGGCLPKGATGACAAAPPSR